MDKKTTKIKIIKIISTLTVLFSISIIFLLIMIAAKVITFNDGMKFNYKIFNSFSNSWYGWILFILMQSIMTMLLCAIPGCSMAFILLSTKLYTESWQAFLLSFISVILTSTFMYIVGRIGGYKICTKLLGENDCDKSMELLREKGTIFFPIMMLFPIFPDDALVMIAGTTKMSLKWFIPSIILGRGIGIFTIIFGFSIIPFESFTSLYDWLVFITVCAFWIFAIFKVANKFNNHVMKVKNKTSNEIESEKNEK